MSDNEKSQNNALDLSPEEHDKALQLQKAQQRERAQASHGGDSTPNVTSKDLPKVRSEDSGH